MSRRGTPLVVQCALDTVVTRHRLTLRWILEKDDENSW